MSTPWEMFSIENYEVWKNLNCYIASMGLLFKTDVPQMNHFIIPKA